ncbi:hypothetical protein [Streptomyces sp. NPDC048710]|uniref:hypothetical protein n=1 Tax=unclassified Streptomyces TaxID=2593676 RepID=UPI0037123B62
MSLAVHGQHLDDGFQRWVSDFAAGELADFDGGVLVQAEEGTYGILQFPEVRAGPGDSWARFQVHGKYSLVAE